MSRWHREHPDYEEMGWSQPDPRDLWDMRDKTVTAPCRVCGEVETENGRACKRCRESMEEDRLERESGR